MEAYQAWQNFTSSVGESWGVSFADNNTPPPISMPSAALLPMLSEVSLPSPPPVSSGAGSGERRPSSGPYKGPKQGGPPTGDFRDYDRGYNPNRDRTPWTGRQGGTTSTIIF